MANDLVLMLGLMRRVPKDDVLSKIMKIANDMIEIFGVMI